ncbi:hypothetical protein AV274_1167 [Blastocystis sp. ATCC 50177/Nand II]|uniref:Large ribosomal subunit protein uL24c n=1 Tax=Blastocystis sp. subtype 1 (strain ATCC 50177 / NandII) TaxID=478820 RepID=A0A196SLI6_BLAHN|nr:hypothetical protein AV274_1167 [Blastocystis sp. ATCC 50177/Nand II]
MQGGRRIIHPMIKHRLNAKMQKKINAADVIGTWTIVRGDTVEVISGKDKGKQGKVLKVDRKLNRVLVDGVNFRKHNVRGTDEQAGGIFEAESFIPYSNVQLLDPESKKPTKVKINKVDGVRQRVSLSSGKVIPKPQESMQRSHPVTSAIGPKDTAPSDVLAVTYNPDVELRTPHKMEFLE